MSQIAGSRASDYKIWRSVRRTTASGVRPGGRGAGEGAGGGRDVWEEGNTQIL